MKALSLDTLHLCVLVLLFRGTRLERALSQSSFSISESLFMNPHRRTQCKHSIPLCSKVHTPASSFVPSSISYLLRQGPRGAWPERARWNIELARGSHKIFNIDTQRRTVGRYRTRKEKEQEREGEGLGENHQLKWKSGERGTVGSFISQKEKK